MMIKLTNNQESSTKIIMKYQIETTGKNQTPKSKSK